MSHEGKKPNIHLQAEAPVSPYVIDLRRPAMPVVFEIPRPTKQERRHIPKLIINPPRPHEIVTMHFDPSYDLLPSHADLFGQFVERDVADPSAFLPFERAARPLITGSVFDVLGEEESDPVEAAFISLQLPEDEILDALAWDDMPDEMVELPARVAVVRFSLPHFHLRLPHGWQKTIAAFVALSFVLVLPIHAMQQVEQVNAQKTAVAAVGASALKHLALGGADVRNNDFALAQKDFAEASESFQLAENRLSELSLGVTTLAHALPAASAQLTTGSALIKAGSALSQAASLFTQALSELESSTSPISKLDVLTLYLERMQPLTRQAVSQLSHVDASVLPIDQQPMLQTITSTLPTLADSIDQFLAFNQAIRLMLGGDGPMRYVLLFQNNAEARATGGFIGSYAEITIDNGQLTAITVPGGGSYDLQGSLSDFVKAPAPLSLINPRFEFQDANWFPDFPTSAEKLLHFYDHAGGPTVDGVLAVNATFVASLIGLIGSIEMESYGRTITGENFLNETQKIVELESDKTLNKPKQFIADLTPKLLDQLSSADAPTFLSLLQQVGQGLSEKEIQLYFTNEALQETVDQLGWSGRLAETDGDYLMVVDSNIGGGKTDLVMDEQIDVKVEINDDGSVVNTATITRTHNGNQSDTLAYVNNVDYLRLFVPSGSELLSATGDFSAPDASLFEPSELPLVDDPDVTANEQQTAFDAASGTSIGTALGKTTFGNWVQTKPGATSVVTFRYRLPFRVAAKSGILGALKSVSGASNTATYTLLAQKQSGALNRQTRITIFPPDSLTPAWSSDDTLTSTGVSFDNTSDSYFASLFTKR